MRRLIKLKSFAMIAFILASIYFMGEDVLGSNSTTNATLDGYLSVETPVALKNYEGYEMYTNCYRGKVTCQAYCHENGKSVVLPYIKSTVSAGDVEYKEFNPDYGVHIYLKLTNNYFLGSKAYTRLTAYNSY